MLDNVLALLGKERKEVVAETKVDSDADVSDCDYWAATDIVIILVIFIIVIAIAIQAAGPSCCATNTTAWECEGSCLQPAVVRAKPQALAG